MARSAQRFELSLIEARRVSFVWRDVVSDPRYQAAHLTEWLVDELCSTAGLPPGGAVHLVIIRPLELVVPLVLCLAMRLTEPISPFHELRATGSPAWSRRAVWHSHHLKARETTDDTTKAGR